MKFPQTTKSIILSQGNLGAEHVQEYQEKQLLSNFLWYSPTFFNEDCNIFHKIYRRTKILCLVLSALRNIVVSYPLSPKSSSSLSRSFLPLPPQTEHLKKLPHPAQTPPLDKSRTVLVCIVS